MKRFAIIFLAILTVYLSSCSSIPDNTTSEFPELEGPYLGQTLPDSLPELFAPGIVATGMFTRDVAISPGGDEILFCVAIANYTFASILQSKIVNGKWTRPEILPFASDPEVMYFEPAFSPDGQRLYFLSNMPEGDEKEGDQDIWYSERTEDGWSEPVNPGAPLNTDGGEFFPSLTRDGYIYYTHNDAGSGLNQIFRSRITGDSFGEPELLPRQVNCGQNRFNAFVSPDHSFVIVPATGMPDSYDQVDYYITFRNQEDQWSEPINLGAAVNKDNTRGWSPYISPDGKFFFFMANWSKEIPREEWNAEKLRKLYLEPCNGNSDIYWMSAEFIKGLRP